jgi:hypothetical protein
MAAMELTILGNGSSSKRALDAFLILDRADRISESLLDIGRSPDVILSGALIGIILKEHLCFKMNLAITVIGRHFVRLVEILFKVGVRLGPINDAIDEESIVPRWPGMSKTLHSFARSFEFWKR